MSKNSQVTKAEESKVEPVVQPTGAAPEGGLLPEMQPTTTPADPVAEGEEQFVEVRVLTMCQLGLANDVAEVPKGSLAGLKSLGYVDDHPDAVAFAKSLKAPKA